MTRLAGQWIGLIPCGSETVQVTASGLSSLTNTAVVRTHRIVGSEVSVMLIEQFFRLNVE